MTPVAVRLMRDLRSAGWQHSVEWQDDGHDADGAPNGDGYEVHWWRRESAAIDLATVAGKPVAYLNYTPVAEMAGDFDDMSVGYRWLAAERLPELRRMALLLGILTPLPCPVPVRLSHSDLCEDGLRERPHLNADGSCSCVCGRCSSLAGRCTCAECRGVDGAHSGHAMAVAVAR